MTKKLMMACTALAAFAALVLPVTASASPVLTDTGVRVPTPTKFKGTLVDVFLKWTSTAGTSTILECTTSMLTGEVVKNNGTEIEGKITSVVSGGTGPQASGEPVPECTGESAFGNASVTAVVSSESPWCLRSINAPKDEFTIIGGSCGGATSNIKFILATTLVGNCEYESTSHLVGTYTTGGTSVTMSLTNTTHGNNTGEGSTNGFKRISGSVFCPSSFSFEWVYELETDTAVTDAFTIS